MLTVSSTWDCIDAAVIGCTNTLEVFKELVFLTFFFRGFRFCFGDKEDYIEAVEGLSELLR